MRQPIGYRLSGAPFFVDTDKDAWICRACDNLYRNAAALREHECEGERPITKWTLMAFTRQVIAELDKEYHLTYVAYDDKLMREQVEAVAAGNWEKVWEASEDWESEQRYHNAVEELETLSRDIAQRWERTFDVDAEDLLNEWDADDRDEVRFAIYDLDKSDPYQELADNTGKVLMRHILRGEDDALWASQYGTGITATDVIKWLREGCEDGSRLPRNPHNVKVVNSILAEAFHTQAVLMGMLVYAVDIGDLYRMGDTEYVDIINPHLYLGNYYHGDGYCEGPLNATIRVKRSDMHTDRGAPGYGWDEVAGVSTSHYETEIKAVNSDSTAQAQKGA